MKYDIKMQDCKNCPKCGKYALDWTVMFAEEKAFSAECPICGLFFANELSYYLVKDADE